MRKFVATTFGNPRQEALYLLQILVVASRQKGSKHCRLSPKLHCSNQDMGLPLSRSQELPYCAVNDQFGPAPCGIEGPEHGIEFSRVRKPGGWLVSHGDNIFLRRN